MFLTIGLCGLLCLFVVIGTRMLEVYKELANIADYRGNGGFVLVRSILYYICLIGSDIALLSLSISLFSLFLHLQKTIQNLIESLGFSIWSTYGPLAVPFMLTFSSIRGEPCRSWRRGSYAGRDVLVCDRCSLPALGGERKYSFLWGASQPSPNLKGRESRNVRFWGKGFGHATSLSMSALSTR